VQDAEEGHGDDGRGYKRPDWQDSDGVHDNRKSWRELVRGSVVPDLQQ